MVLVVMVVDESRVEFFWDDFSGLGNGFNICRDGEVIVILDSNVINYIDFMFIFGILSVYQLDILDIVGQMVV